MGSSRIENFTMAQLDSSRHPGINSYWQKKLNDPSIRIVENDRERKRGVSNYFEVWQDFRNSFPKPIRGKREVSFRLVDDALDYLWVDPLGKAPLKILNYLESIYIYKQSIKKLREEQKAKRKDVSDKKMNEMADEYDKNLVGLTRDNKGGHNLSPNGHIVNYRNMPNKSKGHVRYV